MINTVKFKGLQVKSRMLFQGILQASALKNSGRPLRSNEVLSEQTLQITSKWINFNPLNQSSKLKWC
jgi:hypothetical protein